MEKHEIAMQEMGKIIFVKAKRISFEANDCVEMLKRYLRGGKESFGSDLINGAVKNLSKEGKDSIIEDYKKMLEEITEILENPESL